MLEPTMMMRDLSLGHFPGPHSGDEADDEVPLILGDLAKRTQGLPVCDGRTLGWLSTSFPVDLCSVNDVQNRVLGAVSRSAVTEACEELFYPEDTNIQQLMEVPHTTVQRGAGGDRARVRGAGGAPASNDQLTEPSASNDESRLVAMPLLEAASGHWPSDELGPGAAQSPEGTLRVTDNIRLDGTPGCRQHEREASRTDTQDRLQNLRANVWVELTREAH
jgi:hypothetical protein